MEKPAVQLADLHLREADLLHLLLDSVTDYAIYMLDRDGRVATWNSGAERIKGYSRAEIIGQHFSRFFTLDDQARHVPEAALAAAARDGHYQAEGWRLRKDGTRFWASAVLHRALGPTGELIGFAKVTRDVTERMEAQQALLESERRFRLLVEGVVDYAIYMLDPSGVIINWNAGAERMIGYAAGEIVGHHFSQFYTPADRSAGAPIRAIETARREGRFEAEGWHLRKDGSRFWALSILDVIRNEKGELIGFAEITRDITERQMAQQALRDSERQFRLLVSGVGDYAIYMLDPNGIVTSWNLGAERIKGYSASEILGQHFSRFYTEQDRAAGVPAHALHTAATEGRFEAENWRVRKDGSLFWANVLIQPIRDETGELIGFAKITRDMSERRNAQIALERAQAERAQSQKFEALGQLTSGVAHDFNNLLMVVSGYLTTLKKFAGDDPRGLRAVEAIELASKRGQSLTRQLLSFARRQVLDPQATKLAERVNAAKQLLATSAKTSINIYDSIPPDTWAVRADVNELELSLVNLGLNARDAMPGGGHVTISSQNRRLDGSETPERLMGDFVALSIADTGQGIPPDILPRIFEPFFTTKAEKGSGLGLAQVYGFAKQSGGTLAVHSELGRGTVMTLYLPRASKAAHAEAPLRDGELSRREGNAKILLVEDNPEVADATASMLGELNYSVVKSGNADDALARLKTDAFDLVISDIVMAGTRNGLDLARQIGQRFPQLPVILVTGYSEAGEEAARDFVLLRKPYQLSELARAVSSVLAQAEAGESDKVVKLSKLRPRKPE